MIPLLHLPILCVHRMEKNVLSEFAQILLADQLNYETKNTSTEFAAFARMDDAPLVQYVDKLLCTAVERGASDIHLEPQAEEFRIRFRIDGLLYPIALLPPMVAQRMISRLKIMAQLDIAERRMPQDGQFQISMTQTIDCRISTCPTIYGEKAVLRLLDTQKSVLSIEQLGMNASQQIIFSQALTAAHGMILVTGPTGSGKTVTLYTALNYLNDTHLNITSIEDPVEIHLPGINQVNVNRKAGLDFTAVLRSLLRQDPDIIMIGEMRDRETAEIGMHAAQTGHLVLSTLHTNNAAETLTRLVNMGIPAYDLISSIRLIMAQRLARCLCPFCKIPDIHSEQFCHDWKLSLTVHSTLFTAVGCPRCIQGYQGRTGIFELLPMTEALINAIAQGASAAAITERAHNLGYLSLQQSALEKLRQGLISIAELKRIV